MSLTGQNLEKVRLAIILAGQQSLRNGRTVTLIAVSKTFAVDDIRPAIAAGQLVFGENRVQEALAKWPGLIDEFSDIELHLIGPLQSNKTKEAVSLFDAIHTVDREKIAASLARECERQNKKLQLFVQVNTGEEPQKTGIKPSETVDFVERCRAVHGLDISGLMCLPPFDENPGPHFALLDKLAGQAGVKHLSMGMSGDYETAIGFGASHVRVGSAIFGTRSTAK